jgi:hypothetical protein
MSAPLFPRLRFILWYIAMGFEAAYDELSMNDVFDPDTLGAIEGLGHDETSRVHVPTVIEWIGERFAGQAASSACE